MRSFFLLLILIKSSYSLIPRNPLNYKYTSNFNHRSKDLKEITSQQASIIAKKWLENMIVETIAENSKKGVVLKLANKLVEREDSHIVSGISQLINYIDNDTEGNSIFLAWTPNYDVKKNILFLVNGYIKNDRLVINQIIQSPLWCSSHIESIELKKALVDYSNKNNLELELDKLYKNDLRLSLSWSTWDIEMDHL